MNRSTPSELKSRDWCIEHYVNRGKSMQEIARELQCNASAVIYWMARHAIQRRTAIESNTIARERSGMRSKVVTTLYITPEQDVGLKMLAETSGVRVAEHIRMAIDRYLGDIAVPG